MEYLDNFAKIICQIISLKRFFFFFILFLMINNAFSQENNINPTVDSSKCKFFKINNNRKCIDTTIIFFPEYNSALWLDSAFNFEKSMTLQLMEEQKWYEKKGEDKIRICLLGYADGYDSAKVFILHPNYNNISLKKKEGLMYQYYDLWNGEILCTQNRSDYYYTLKTKNITSKDYKTLYRLLKKIKSLDTFATYSHASPFIIEYVINDNYHIIISENPSRANKNLLRIKKWIEKIDK